MISIYDTTTGQIVRRVSCPASMNGIQAKAGEAFVEGDYYELSYCVDVSDPENPTPTLKLAITVTIDKPAIIADNTDAALVTGLPTVCTVHEGDTEIAVTDGSFIFTSDQPGAYHFVIDEVGYLETEFTINAS